MALSVWKQQSICRIFIINAVIDGVILYRIQKISRQCAGKIQEAVDELSGNIIDEDDVK